MCNAVNETQCTHCVHREVCSHKERFLSAQKAVDEFTVSYADREFIRLRDIPWIKPVKLECSYFSGRFPVMRESVQTAALLAAQAPAVKFMEDLT